MTNTEMLSERDQKSDQLDLRPYFDFIRRNSRFILMSTAIFVVIAAALSLILPQPWTATSTVIVPPTPATPATQVVGGVQATSPAVVYSQETYARLLTSTTLLQMVIYKLHLQLDRQALARMIQVRPIRDTLLIGVTVTGRDKRQTEDIANALADSLVEYDRQGVTSELSQSRRFVEGQLVSARAELQARETALKQFNERENLAALQAELNQQLSNLTTFRQAYQQNNFDLEIARQRLAQVERELTSTKPLRLSSTSTTINTLGTSSAAGLRAKLADLNTQRATLLQQYTLSYPAVTNIDAQIAQTQKALADAERREPSAAAQETNSVRVQLEAQKGSLDVEVAGLEAKERLLSSALPRTEWQVQALNTKLAEKNAEATQLSRALDAAKATFVTLSAKATDAVVAEGMKYGFVRVADRAAARPKPKGIAQRVALAALLGFISGILGASVMERFSIPMPGTSERSAPDSRGSVRQIARPG